VCLRWWHGCALPSSETCFSPGRSGNDRPRLVREPDCLSIPVHRINIVSDLSRAKACRGGGANEALLARPARRLPGSLSGARAFPPPPPPTPATIANSSGGFTRDLDLLPGGRSRSPTTQACLKGMHCNFQLPCHFAHTQEEKDHFKRVYEDKCIQAQRDGWTAPSLQSNGQQGRRLCIWYNNCPKQLSCTFIHSPADKIEWRTRNGSLTTTESNVPQAAPNPTPAAPETPATPATPVRASENLQYNDQIYNDLTRTADIDDFEGALRCSLDTTWQYISTKDNLLRDVMVIFDNGVKRMLHLPRSGDGSDLTAILDRFKSAIVDMLSDLEKVARDQPRNTWTIGRI